MRPFKDKLRTIIAILIILLLTPTIALSAGVHLSLCISLDGHTQNGHTQMDLYDCTIDPIRQCDQQQDDQGDDCWDIIIGCASSDKEVLLSGNAYSSKTSTRRDGSPSPRGNHFLKLSSAISQYPIRIFSQLKCETPPSANLVPISTVVLLI
ncbi:MAG: hypothetical protein JRD47_03680 [Deltaproteobacteria bacterium]|nr:hypothetical protein [Deltaproteobacteria bacterium]MBW2601017.1 hypothetical protein [Deltaproteobacteria bacterium]